MSEPRTDDATGEAPTPLDHLDDFSLVCGGPLFQLLRRTRLAGDGLQLVHRRVLVLVLLSWVPLLVLSIVEGTAWGASVPLSFLRDVETHMRLLLAVPLLILAELLVHRIQPAIVRQFVSNGLIRDEARPQFDAAIASALRLRNSLVAELALIVFVYAVSLPFIWRDQLALDVDSWFATAGDGRLQPSLAGWWLGLVSMPLLQYLLLRWYYRIFIWARFLWQVAKTGLNLEPTHPDGTAGLLFLARSGRAYRLLLLAIGTMLSGMIANRIFQTGATLMQFKLEIIGTVAVAAFLVLGPLIVFNPQLRAARRRGMIQYGTLGQAYAREFNRKWILGQRADDEALLGNADFQSLADLHNGFEVIRGIRLLPFTMKNFTELAAYVLLPVAPLLLTTFSVEQLLDRMLKSLF
jgi:hypothetical protein